MIRHFWRQSDLFFFHPAVWFANDPSKSFFFLLFWSQLLLSGNFVIFTAFQNKELIFLEIINWHGEKVPQAVIIFFSSVLHYSCPSSTSLWHRQHVTQLFANFWTKSMKPFSAHYIFFLFFLFFAHNVIRCIRTGPGLQLWAFDVVPWLGPALCCWSHNKPQWCLFGVNEHRQTCSVHRQAAFTRALFLCVCVYVSVWVKTVQTETRTLWGLDGIKIVTRPRVFF